MKTTLRVTLVGAAVALSLLAPSRAALAATSTSLSPASVAIAPGGSATIRISTVGVPYSASGATTVYGSFWLNVPTGYTISDVACTGIFTGASPYTDGSALIACEFPFSGPGVTGPTGDVLTFTLTRGTTSPTGTVTFDTESSGYVVNDESNDPIGTTNAVAVTDAVTVIPVLGMTGLVALAGLILAGGLTLLRARSA